MPITMGSQELEVRRVRGKGRGVFARQAFAKGDLIMEGPVLIGRHEEMNGGPLANYTFHWSRGKSALALGFVSLLNHACPSVAVYRFLYKRQLIRIVARCDISPGTEVTINYNHVFDDPTPVGFEAIP